MIQKSETRRLFLPLIVLVLLELALTSCATNGNSRRSLTYAPEIFSQVDFIKHEGNGPMKSYLALNVNLTPVAELRQRLETEIANELRSRPEAHITIINPIEYDKVLSKKIKMHEINVLAEKALIQNIKFKPICIGKGSAHLNNDTVETYFVVVNSDELYALRAEIQKLFISKGGLASEFHPEIFYPHITLGYTQRDLHFEDGVVKDERSCLYQLHE